LVDEIGLILHSPGGSLVVGGFAVDISKMQGNPIFGLMQKMDAVSLVGS